MTQRISDFLLGMVAACIIATALLAAHLALLPSAAKLSGAKAVTFSTEPEAAALETEVAACVVYFDKVVDAELPWITRPIAHRIAPWAIRKVAHIQVARHGHQIAPVLEFAEPYADDYLKPEMAQAIRTFREACETDVSEWGR